MKVSDSRVYYNSVLVMGCRRGINTIRGKKRSTSEAGRKIGIGVMLDGVNLRVEVHIS